MNTGMDWGTVAVAMGASWASGVRLYGAAATLGLLHYFKLTNLPGSLDALSHPWVIAVAIFLFVIEFLADKIPAVDSAWDAVHTFIRIPAGVVLASAAFTNYPTHITVIAGLIGGTLALSSHTSKSANRVIINHSPEPVSNWVHSVAQDITGIGVALLSPFLPFLTIVIVFLFVSIGTLIFVKALPLLKRRLKSKS